MKPQTGFYCCCTLDSPEGHSMVSLRSTHASRFPAEVEDLRRSGLGGSPCLKRCVMGMAKVAYRFGSPLTCSASINRGYSRDSCELRVCLVKQDPPRLIHGPNCFGNAELFLWPTLRKMMCHLYWLCSTYHLWPPFDCVE